MSYAKIRPRRSTKTEWELVNPILMEGELGVEFPDTGIGTGLCKFKIGNGFSSWKDLAYAFDATASSSINGGSVTESNEIILRSGTTEEWETINPILKNSEIVYDTTKKAIKIGDGVSTFKELDYFNSSWEMDEDYNFGDLDGDDTPVTEGDYNFGDIDLGDTLEPEEETGGNCSCMNYTDEEIEIMLDDILGGE